MKKLLTIPLFLLSFYSYAGLEAIGGSDEAYNAPPGPLESFCQTDGTWQLCADTQDALPAMYTDAFYVESTRESIAFGYLMNNDAPSYYRFAVACKDHGDTQWKDCTPDNLIPGSQYYKGNVAHDGNGNFMIIGGQTSSSELIATCRNASGEWLDCSPPTEYAKDFSFGGMGYGDNQWMLLEYDFPIREGKMMRNPAICMDATTSVWGNCDIRVPDPDESFFTFNNVSYIAAESLWVATGYQYTDNQQVLFRSVCRKNTDTLWSDCTGDAGNFNAGGVRLVNDDKAGLLQINWWQDPITYKGYSVILCKAPNESWKDCTGNSFQADHRYYGATTDTDGNWVMVGNFYETLTGGDTIAYLTAVQNNDEWQITTQAPTTGASMLYDIFLVKE